MYTLLVSVTYRQSVFGNSAGCAGDGYGGELPRTDTRVLLRSFGVVTVQDGNKQNVPLVLPHPFVLVHGIASGTHRWRSWSNALTDDGRMVIAVNYEGRITKTDSWTAAQQAVQAQIISALTSWVDSASSNNGYPNWHLIAHSQGGLVAKVMATRTSGSYNAALISAAGQFVLLGTPNSGALFSDAIFTNPTCYGYLESTEIVKHFNKTYPDFGATATYAFAGDTSFTGVRDLTDGIVAVESVLSIGSHCGVKKSCSIRIPGELVHFDHFQLGAPESLDEILRVKILPALQ